MALPSRYDLEVVCFSARSHSGIILTSFRTRTARDDGLPIDVNSIVNSRFSRSTREKDIIFALGPEGSSAPQEAIDAKAWEVIRRVQDKLAGLDFGNEQPYRVNIQVDRLIQQVRACVHACVRL